ncbi:NTP pyrophosphatase, house-cleaning of non-canonical NTPs [Rhizobium sp. RU35A]|uniref:Pyrophosphatase n=1 Tax=Rhizobium straminoryzae TaxID=1387186 RepID=A0A549TBV0_9HYPH|nr:MULTISPECIES: MazG nucleotide pyrophosphohydrolase domain-containing protein [Rhizobium]TRL39369.1 pyrophosphatase [Rhizobium straminoryzae]SIP97704.1 NTP pyrophosphatase, house-cleaning of non-canonical NTPs [Rhizobium sp. RU35A]
MLDDLMKAFDAASRRYAEAHGLTRDPDWFVLKLHEEVGELTQAWNRLSGRGRPKGRSVEDMQRDLADEAADVLGHILLLAHANGLDLAAAVERKWLFRPA